MRATLSRVTDAQQDVEIQEKTALDLIDKLQQADSPYMKEKIMRDELDLQKPGDTIIQLPQTTN
ncbi:hypothetical protein C5B42_03475 [Candidatus Cerribacteria bacterium 'Amazon FNV 2010 28 9']|uniref:Uncharacterized protein n=1 Tax=Candidatus Cerribacteria bacterium 'Amazon FNV 2010 28 9' TaxID=2081795 RepID=A0A317JNM9_9BACT|nr:MAG: hypothetical protein C5B42_03475 [Candidatus Cerribacteria bacterium 'Amazon FNV 2010 28 9']